MGRRSLARGGAPAAVILRLQRVVVTPWGCAGQAVLFVPHATSVPKFRFHCTLIAENAPPRPGRPGGAGARRCSSTHHRCGWARCGWWGYRRPPGGGVLGRNKHETGVDTGGTCVKGDPLSPDSRRASRQLMIARSPRVAPSSCALSDHVCVRRAAPEWETLGVPPRLTRRGRFMTQTLNACTHPPPPYLPTSSVSELPTLLPPPGTHPLLSTRASWVPPSPPRRTWLWACQVRVGEAPPPQLPAR
jgi:hypothetical protein